MEINALSLLTSQALNNQYYQKKNITKYVAKKGLSQPAFLRTPCRGAFASVFSPSLSSLHGAGSRHLPEEDMAALFADVGPEPQELAVDPVQDGLEVLALPGVLAIKQF